MDDAESHKTSLSNTILTWTDFAGTLAAHLPLEGFIQKTGSAIKLRYENLQIHQTWAR